ncbi:hypothetical protein XYCOK13_07930 [Xylanibacillus composti]|uniref:Uncharacterized protein n=1 Tax=Xylanibacillus composti TaxID=1572762 RepID=A0A8J4M0Y9_9BACL|nr:hypothetical protein XYCOK13_07930 [Xylanibacillus composti]
MIPHKQEEVTQRGYSMKKKPRLPTVHTGGRRSFSNVDANRYTRASCALPEACEYV